MLPDRWWMREEFPPGFDSIVAVFRFLAGQGGPAEFKPRSGFNDLSLSGSRLVVNGFACVPLLAARFGCSGQPGKVAADLMAS